MVTYDEIFRDTGRVEAFSDGVFAIAITLLVIDIKIPPHLGGRRELMQSLVAEWPDFAAYLTSFATIGTMWVSHHFIFEHIRRVDTLLFYANLLVLALITFINVPTQLVAEYLGTPGERLAGSLYTGTILAISFSNSMLWRHAARKRRLIADSVQNARLRRITRSYRVRPLCRLVAFGLSFWNVYAAMALTLGLSIYFTIPPSRKYGSEKEILAQ